MSMIIDGTAGITFPDSSVQPVASSVTKLITDSTDIAMTAVLGTSQQNVGSSFSINIPTSGLIKISGITGRFLNSAAATAHYYAFGIRIASTNYWFNQANSNGTVVITAGAASIGAGSTANAYAEVNGASGGASTSVSLSAMDIVGLSIPTGTQTVQLVTSYITTAGTIKGTVKQTRITLEFVTA
jgi:hypothetical protein